MSKAQTPSGIYPIIGDFALKLYNTKNDLIKLYLNQGFNFCTTPLINFASNDTSFKFADNLSNKSLEIVDDITPQISIIDGMTSGIKKYCYAQNIIKQNPDDFYSSRMPTQVGAEIYDDTDSGSNNINYDLEIIQLMLESLKVLNINDITISIGNLKVFNHIITNLQLLENLDLQDQYNQLKDIFARKSLPDLMFFIEKYNIKSNLLLEYFKCNEPLILSKLINSEVIIDELQNTSDLVNLISKNGFNNVVFDMQDTKSYYYHDGIIFSAYSPEYPKAIARGGRFSGENNRNGVGFSFDLEFLLQN